MASPVSSLFQFYILACLAITRGDYHCGTQGTYKKNSAYEKNLNYTLSTLTESLRGDGFFKTDSESNSDHDTAYALALCQGNIEDDRCRGCVQSATDRLRKDCPNQKEATAWHWGTCMLSYSNTTFDIVDDKDVIPFKTNRFSNSWDSVLNTLQSLFGQLRGKAASGGYNTDNVTVYSGGSGVYIEAKMQCIPDISRQKCDECLMKASNYLLNCCNGSGQLVVFYQYTCLLSYSVSTPSIFFVNTSVPPATPSLVLVPPLMAPTIPSTNLPPPPGEKSSNFIAPAVAAAAVTLAISTIFVFIKIRRTCSKKGQRYIKRK